MPARSANVVRMPEPQQHPAADPAREPWVDIRAVALHTGLSRITIKSLYDQGKIPAWNASTSKRCAHLRFKLSMVDAALEKMIQVADNEQG